MATVFLNGEFVAQEDARISVLDRGFLFGDGVYEVIPAYAGHLFRLDQHLTRLDNSLAAIRLADPLSHAQWAKVLGELVTRNGADDLSVYLQVTRGVSRRDHAFPSETRPTVFAMCNPLPSPSAQLLRTGVTAIALDDIRWKYCNVKAITLLPNVLLRQQAVDAAAAEAILLRDGCVTEGAASNVFIVRHGTLLTPPADAMLLPGITRDLVLELAHQHGIACREAVVRESDLREAEEIWLTSSTREILPVTRLDEAHVGNGKPGPLWQRINQIFQEYKANVSGGS